MAMTGGTAKLVKSYTPSGWPGPINLYVYYKLGQANTANNTTTITLGMYLTTPTGWYIGPWSEYSGSYVGAEGTHKTFDGAIGEGTQGTVWLTENQQVTVTHNADGSKTAAIQWKWGVSSDSDYGYGSNSGSFQVALSTIPRASLILAAGNVTLGESCSVRWKPNAASFRYKLKFALGSWSYTTGVLHPNQTADYTYTGYVIPLDAAKQIPNSKSGTMTVTLYTYSDSGGSTQVGSADSESFTVSVPVTDATKPGLTMTLAPESSLDATYFAGLYVQGKCKVKGTLSGSGKYGATIASYSLQVGGVSYGSGEGYTSGYLTGYGAVKVTGVVTDSRGISNTVEQEITVLPYASPQVVAASGESEVTARRCNSAGTAADNGTYLQILAKRVYSPVVSGGTAKNACQIRYRYKAATAASYGSWVTILSGGTTGTDEIKTGALLSGALAVTQSYEVQVQATDRIEEGPITTITVPTESVYSHEDGANGAFGFGEYADEVNAFTIGTSKKLRIKGGLALSNTAAMAIWNAIKVTALKAVYPVGHVYISTVSTSPATLFGFGTWEQIQNRFLLAAGSSYAAGSTGGEATATLTEDQIPSHSHTVSTAAGGLANDGGVIQRGWGGSTSYVNFGTSATGGGGAHNNMPPYLAVYVWKRTA